MNQTPTEERIYEGAQHIRNLVGSGNPFFIGRNGTIEIEVLFFWVLRRRTGRLTPYPTYLQQQIQQNAGVFPGTPESIDSWCKTYIESLEHMDGGAAGWYEPLWRAEKAILDIHAPNAFRTPLRSLEPYYVPPGLRWTEQLVGKHVAVVSSFADSMQAQIQRPNDIWTGAQEGLLDISGATWTFIRTGYAPITAMGNAEWPGTYDTWQKAVEYVVEAVVASGAQLTLIGCGGLGMIIAGRLKARGISAFVLGGAIQVLFGIKGRRWATHSVISHFWNDAWVWPSPVEIPGAAVSVEGGCYWRL
ncbi:MAG: hypothetical protein EBU66_05565 [Bacteroidetes bacterium]|nr:hypothetical protein [bacterium]NBP64130.1 hypothetical protein [Bacteroidota bacterium]